MGNSKAGAAQRKAGGLHMFRAVILVSILCALMFAPVFDIARPVDGGAPGSYTVSGVDAGGYVAQCLDADAGNSLFMCLKADNFSLAPLGALAVLLVIFAAMSLAGSAGPLKFLASGATIGGVAVTIAVWGLTWLLTPDSFLRTPFSTGWMLAGAGLLLLAVVEAQTRLARRGD